jgi:hypothetical protein
MVLLKVLPAAGKAWLTNSWFCQYPDPAQWQFRKTFLPLEGKAVGKAGRHCEEQLVILAVIECLRG